MRRAHHRQERIDRECDDRRRVADAKKWDEKAEHRDRWYCIKEINYAKRRCRRTLIAINENARRTADDDGNADRRARNPKVLDHQLQKERTALRHHRNYCMQQRHGITLPYRIRITNLRRSMDKIDAPRRHNLFSLYHIIIGRTISPVYDKCYGMECLYIFSKRTHRVCLFSFPMI